MRRSTTVSVTPGSSLRTFAAYKPASRAIDEHMVPPVGRGGGQRLHLPLSLSAGARPTNGRASPYGTVTCSVAVIRRRRLRPPSPGLTRTTCVASSGNSRATTATPARNSPPDTTDSWVLTIDATVAASMSPIRGPLVTTRMWIDVTLAVKRVGRLELDDRGAEHRGEDVRGAGDGQEEERERERERRQPEQRDRGAPDRDRHATTPTPIRRTAGTQPENTAPQQRPDGRRRGHQAQPGRSHLEHVERERREQRGRHAEDHRVEVDDERREDDLLGARTKLRPCIADSPGRGDRPSGGSGAIAAIPASDAVNVSTSAR